MLTEGADMMTWQIVHYFSDGGYLLLFGLSLSHALRSRSRLGFHVALFFGAIAIAVVLALLSGADGDNAPRLVRSSQGLLIMALPYLLLRLLHDLDGVALALLRCAEVGLVLSAVALYGFAPPYPDGLVLPLVAYFVTLQSYVSVRFVLTAKGSRGLIKRRLQWVAAGSLLIAAAILLAGLHAIVPVAEGSVEGVTAALGLASAVSYYVGFATPGVLKRGWRATDLREFLELSSGAVGVEQLSSSRDLAAALEQRVAAMVGANRAVILLWDEHAERLTVRGEPIRVESGQPERFFAFRVFKEQRARFTPDATRDDPGNAEVYRETGSRAIFAAPITFRERRLGVLVAFGARPSLFAQDDLDLVRVLAEQIGSFLVFREFLERASALEAQERANELREEFLAAAAHDLKTPLTVLVGEVQLMRREARANPELGEWHERLERMDATARRMRRLIDDLLDASRVEQDGFVRELKPVDLGSLAREVADSLIAPSHSITVDAPPVAVTGDRERLRQVFTNLLENAVKYSPGGGAIAVRVEASGDDGLLTVSDQGIGVPQADQVAVFERFQRGSNLAGVRSGGMGIGLYLCRRIVEEHGGRISLQSRPGEGATFTVTLPRATAASPADTTPPVQEGRVAHVGSSAGSG